MSNAKFTPTTPHFFQPLLPGFHHHLTIPLSFLNHYLKSQTNLQRAVLRSHGRIWSVKIRDRRFEDGWGDFAKDHDLHVGDFLVFGYVGNLVFDVVVFDTSACRREYPLSATKDPTERLMEKIHEKRASTSVSHGTPHFVTTLNPDSFKSFRLNVPRKFARSNGLLGRHCEMVVVDEQRRSWIVSLRHKESDGQVYIGYGWRDICIGNHLVEMDCVLFELIGNGATPVFKLYTVASNSDCERMSNYPNSNTGRSGSIGICRVFLE